MFSVRDHPLHISTGVTHLCCFLFCVSLPGVSLPTSSALPWGVPCDGLTGDNFWRFSECVSYPLPFSLLYFIFYGLVIFQSVVLDTLSADFKFSRFYASIC